MVSTLWRATKALESWLNENQLTERNRFNTVRLIRTVLRWVQMRGNLRSGTIETDELDSVVPTDGEIEIFSPEELKSLLSVSKPTMIPYFTLGALAGLRAAEIQRLTWEDYKPERGFIEVGRSKAKTRSRRLVPIFANSTFD